MEKKSYYKIHITAFFTAFLFALAAYAASGIYPFGKYSVLTADLKSQYIDAAAAFFNQLKNGENVFITWRSGLGSNLYALALYIMANPLSILFLFFEPRYYQEIYFVILLVKFGFTAMCFSVFAARSTLLKADKMLENVAFSLSYALSVFAIKATANPMWLENIAVLPLLLLGIEKTVDKRRPALFFAAAAFCFITNYYLAYMSGLFAVIYFAYYCAVTEQKGKDAVRSLVFCAVFAVLAIGTAMFVILPSLTAISRGYTQVVGVGYKNGLFKFSLRDIAFVFTYVISYYTASGYPSAYFGILPLLFAITYFVNKKIPKKEKIASAVVCLVFFLSLVIEPVYLVWHLFREPTGFEGRFLYTAVLFALILAIRSVKNAGGINKKAFAVIAAVVFAAANFGVGDRINNYYLLCIAVLIVLLLAYSLLFARFGACRPLYMMLICEMLVVSVNSIRIIKLWDGYAERGDHITYTGEYKDAFASLKLTDPYFYRSDIDIRDTYNVSMSIGYNGINHYSSLANQKTFDTMRRLGTALFYDNKVLLPLSQNAVLDSLFDIKYFFVTNEKDMKTDTALRKVCFNGLRLTNPSYVRQYTAGDGLFYENTTVFPLLFAVDGGLDGKEIQLDETAFFDNQEKFFAALFGTENTELYDRLAFESASTLNCNAAADENGLISVELTELEDGKQLAEDPNERAKIIFEYTAAEDGNYFTVLNGEFTDNEVVSKLCSWVINGSDIPVVKMDNELKDLGYFKKGDVISLVYYGNTDTKIYWPPLYRLKSEVLADLSQRAESGALENIKEVKGNIAAEASFGEERLVFSSIAYDSGMSVYIDGIKTETVDLADGFLGFRVPSGRHEIKISYVSPGAAVGAVISLISAVIGILSILICYKRGETKK